MFKDTEYIEAQSKLSEEDILKELLDVYKFAITTAWQLNDVTLDAINDKRRKKVIAYLDDRIKTAGKEKK